MRIDRKRVLAIVAICTVVLASGIARADWMPEDGHKMHFPQLPDPNGWDVDVTRIAVADDWKCSQSGAVDDIHFWISAEQDYTGNGIDFIDVAIYTDVAAGTDPDTTITWSHPGEQKWASRVQDQAGTGDVFTILDPPLQGNQGWYTPDLDPPNGVGYYSIPDHIYFWQVNIQDIVDPFEQTEGEIYWLEINIVPNGYIDSGGPFGDGPFFGWKTSQNHWNDDAAYMDAPIGGPGEQQHWHELFDPRSEHHGVSLDMAFVITPEPVTILVLALGLLPILLLKRHRKVTA